MLITGSSGLICSEAAIYFGGLEFAFVVFPMSEPVLFSRYGWISAALVLALRGVQQEGLASLEPAPHTGVARRTVAASLQP